MRIRLGNTNTKARDTSMPLYTGQEVILLVLGMEDYNIILLIRTGLKAVT